MWSKQHFISHDSSAISGLTTLPNLPAPIIEEDRHVHNPRPTNGVPGLGAYISCGAVSTQNTTVFVAGVSELERMEVLILQGRHTILPGWRWLRETRTVSDGASGYGVSMNTSMHRWYNSRTKTGTPRVNTTPQLVETSTPLVDR